jgi:hypothetical protein
MRRPSALATLAPVLSPLPAATRVRPAIARGSAMLLFGTADGTAHVVRGRVARTLAATPAPAGARWCRGDPTPAGRLTFAGGPAV